VVQRGPRFTLLHGQSLCIIVENHGDGPSLNARLTFEFRAHTLDLKAMIADLETAQ
jgi:hypothetical protein